MHPYSTEYMLHLLRQAVIDVAQDEDITLRLLCKKGIFFMPELAFAYEVGKELVRMSKANFETEEIEWNREVKLGDAGPTDMLFKVGDHKSLAIEFKMVNTVDAYCADIRKLQQLPSEKYERVFCAIIDAFEYKNLEDERILGVEATFGNLIERIPAGEPFRWFPVHNDTYRASQCCVIALWRLRDNAGL